MVRHTAVLATLAALAAAGARAAEADWPVANEFLQGVVLAQSVDLNESVPFQASIAAREVGAGETVGSVVSAGNLLLKGVACEAVKLVGDLSLAASSTGPLEVQSNFAVTDVDYACVGELQWNSLAVGSFGDYTGSEISPSGSANFSVARPAGGPSTPARFASNIVWTLGPGRRPTDPVRPVGLSLDESSCLLDAPESWVQLPPGVSSSSDGTGLLKVLIAALLERTLVCPTLALASANGTAALEALNALVDDLVQDEPSKLADMESSLVAQLSDEERNQALDLSDSGLAQVAMRFANQILSAPANRSDPMSDLSVNGFVRDLTGSEAGATSVNLTSALGPDGLVLDGAVALGQVFNVSGLDTFTALNLFQVAEGLSLTLLSDFALSELVFSARPTLRLVAQGGQLANGDLVFQRGLDLQFDAIVALTGVDAQVAQAAAVAPGLVNDVALGQVLDNLVGCSAPAIFLVNVTTLALDLAQPAELSIGSFADPGMAAAEADLNSLVQMLWQDSFAAVLPNATRGMGPLITELVNQELADRVAAGPSKACPSTAPYANEGELVDFSSKSADAVRAALDETVADADDPNVGINKIIRELSELGGTEPGVIAFESNFSLAIEVDSASSVTIDVSSLRLENVDSFQSAVLLQPTGDDPSTTTHNKLAFGKAGRTLRVSAVAALKGSGELDYDEQGTLSVDLSNLELETTLQISVLLDSLMRLPLGNLVSASCLASTLDYDGPNMGLGIKDLVVNVTGLAFDCSSCNLDPNQEKEIADSLLIALEAGVPVVAKTAGSGDAKRAINDGLFRAGAECTGGLPEPAPSARIEDAGVLSVLIVNGIALLGATGALVAVGAFARRRSRVKEPATSSVTAEKVDPFEDPVQNEASVLSWAAADERSLLASPGAKGLKLASLLLIALSLGLFLWADLSVSARVEAVSALSSDKDLVLDDIFELTLTRTINDLFNAGIAWVGVLVALMSGSWPFLRLLLLLVCLVVPPRALPVKTRGNLLALLDFFGKWVVVDQFLVLVLIGAFDVRVLFPEAGSSFTFVPSGAVDLRVGLVPVWGLYAFFLGACATIVASILVSALHRNVASPTATNALHRHEDRRVAVAIRRKEKIGAHVFEPPHAHPDYRLQMRISGAKFFGIASSLVCIGLLVGGFFVKIVTFQYRGLGGAALGLLKEDGERVSFSIFDFATALAIPHASASQVIGVVFLQFVFFATVIVAPVLQQVLLVLEMVLPLTLREMRFLCFGVQSLAATCALEVFAVACAVSVGLIGTFVSFAVRRLCVDVDKVIVDWLVPFGVLDESEGTCFTMSGNLTGGFVLVVGAALLGLLNVYFVNSITRLAIEEREASLRAIRGLPPGRPNTENALGFFSFAVAKHLRFLNQMGLVQVRKVLFTTPSPVSSQGSSASSLAFSPSFSEEDSLQLGVSGYQMQADSRLPPPAPKSPRSHQAPSAERISI